MLRRSLVSANSNLRKLHETMATACGTCSRLHVFETETKLKKCLASICFAKHAFWGLKAKKGLGSRMSCCGTV